jgi:ribosomal-protein-alanine N-acetyltransferase
MKGRNREVEIKKNHQLILAENQRLETPRLWLRPVTMADAEDLFVYAKDEENTAFVFLKHQTIEDTQNMIASYFLAAPLGKYAIEEKASKKMIGTIDLRVDSVAEIAELGYTLNKAFWGRGFVPEAAGRLLQLGFEELDLIRIYGLHDQQNQRSGRVMEKIGMKVEARIPASRKFRGRIIDEVMQGITRKEWQSRKERSEHDKN